MAETLGSMVDKLTIKNLREYHIQEMMQSKKCKFPKAELKKKLSILSKQKEMMYKEINQFVEDALSKDIQTKDEKLKIYNKPSVMGKTQGVKTLAQAIEKLGQKNIQLWHLEDEARREDVDLTYIGEIKRKIDVTNQSRNDFMDLVDELFSELLEKKKKKK